MDRLYASVVSGELVAVRPQVKGALALKTMTCNVPWDLQSCRVVSTSPKKIDTGNAAVDAAHNHAWATYKFYKDNFGRDSIDDAGMQIVSMVQGMGIDMGAFWDGANIKYGSGDGFITTYYSLGADVVAHEITHGVTDYTSDLIQHGEASAISEAMSDIFGACVDWQVKRKRKDVWRFGEDVLIDKSQNNALRRMDDPAQTGDYDWYSDFIPDRFTWGLNPSSGVINLAFVLMVQGGSHPHGKSNVVVAAIDDDFETSLLAAANIFYQANINCLTPMSTFYDIRRCTEQLAGDHQATVSAAWDAVGVAPRNLKLGIPVTIKKAKKGERFEFVVVGVPAGSILTCTTEGLDGDADLYLYREDPLYFYENGDYSTEDSSNEECALGPYPVDDIITYVTVVAFKAFTDLSLQCTESASDWIILQNDVAVEDVKVKFAFDRKLILSDIKPCSTVTCDIRMTKNGGVPSLISADMFGRRNYEWWYENSVSVYGEDISDEQESFALTTGFYDGLLLISLTSGINGVRGLSINCKAQSENPPMLGNWVLYEDSSAKFRPSRFYVLKTTLQMEEQVTCVARSESEVVFPDICITFGSLKDTSKPSFRSCSWYNEITSLPAISKTRAMLELSLYGLNETSPNVICGKEPKVESISHGVWVTGLSGVAGKGTALRMYRLGGVQRGERVTCEIHGSNGNANLYVRSGGRSYPLSPNNDCQVRGPSSNGKCTTQVVEKDTAVYASIHAVQSYSGLKLQCKRDASQCKAKGEACTKALECCGSKSTCDGSPSSEKKCKKAVPRGGECVRNSQCAVGNKCKQNRCRRN